MGTVYSPREDGARGPWPVVATVHRQVNMGDHALRLPELAEVLPGETVVELANRLLNRTGTYYQTDTTDTITLQVLVPAEMLDEQR